MSDEKCDVSVTEKDKQNQIKKIIKQKILTWNTENIDDVEDAVNEVLEISVDMCHINYGIDLLATITPPSAISTNELEKLFGDNDCDTDYVGLIWAIDKNGHCYRLIDGGIEEFSEVIELPYTTDEWLEILRHELTKVAGGLNESA